MASTFTSRLKLDKMALGDDIDSWGTTLNLDFDLIDSAIAGREAISTTGGTTTLTSTNGAADQARMMILDVSGVLVSNATIDVPDSISKLYVVNNITTGDYTVTVKTVSGTGVVVPQGHSTLVWSNATNVISHFLIQGRHTMPVPAYSMITRTTNGAPDGVTELATNQVMLVTKDFDASTDEFVQFYVPMPKSWDKGTVTAQFIWTAASSAGDVIWGLQGLAVSNDEALDQAFGTAQVVTDTLIAANDQHTTSETAAITIAGTPAEGDLVLFQVYRDANAGGDTLGVDAKLIAVKLYLSLSAPNDK